jgi:AraC-like DNA-binding protein
VFVRQRLKNSADGLSAIAQSLGYESESAFGKAFRRVMGRSPRQYARAAPNDLPLQLNSEDREQELVVTPASSSGLTTRQPQALKECSEE